MLKWNYLRPSSNKTQMSRSHLGDRQMDILWGIHQQWFLASDGLSQTRSASEWSALNVGYLQRVHNFKGLSYSGIASKGLVRDWILTECLTSYRPFIRGPQGLQRGLDIECLIVEGPIPYSHTPTGLVLKIPSPATSDASKGGGLSRVFKVGSRVFNFVWFSSSRSISNGFSDIDSLGLNFMEFIQGSTLATCAAAEHSNLYCNIVGV